MTAMKRVAGVEPGSLSSLSALAPPAHDTSGGVASGGAPIETTAAPSEAFGLHFFRCFFCRIGDNRIEDHFCETGRDLLTNVLDELADRLEWL